MRKLLLFAAILILGTTLYAQNVKLGLRLSPLVSFASIADSNGNSVSDELRTKVGLSYGLTVKYYPLTNENIAIISGIHIVNRGYRRDGSIELNDTSTVVSSENVRFTTVEIPVMLQGRTGDIGGGIHIVGNFGTTIDVTAGYRNQWTGVNPFDYSLSAEGGTLTGTDKVTPVNLSFVFGAGIDWDISNVGTVNVGINYHQGLTRLNRQSGFQGQTRSSTEEIRMNYIVLDLNFFFGT